MSTYGPRADSTRSVQEARTLFSGSCSGTISIASTSSTEDFPFREWVNEEWRVVNVDQFMAKREAAAAKGKSQGRLSSRATKVIDLKEEGLTLSGTKYKPPAFLWNEQVEMRDCLRGHFHPNVQSYSRRPQLHAVEELDNLCISILPSVSGGFMLTQEALPNRTQAKQNILLCLNKSVWRDRITLEEGMEFEFGTNAETCMPMGRIRIEAISGTDRNLSRYSGANNSNNRASLTPSSKKKNSAPKKKSVSFGDSVLIDSGEKICALDKRDAGESEDGFDMMTSRQIWSETSSDISGVSPGESLANNKLERPRLALTFILDGVEKVAEFVPTLPELLQYSSNSPASSPLIASYSRRKSAHPKRRNMTFTIGGDANCDLVIPNCAVKVVATIVAFENVFTLVVPHNLCEIFSKGKRLSKVEARFAQESSVHMRFNPEKSYGVYDGDVIVFRKEDCATCTKYSDGCCSGVEMSVRIFDTTEDYRTKLNKSLLEALGIKWDFNLEKSSFRRRISAIGNFRSRSATARDVEDLALEVRAPVRTSRWDGSNEWRYGDTEAFILSGISAQEEASIGSSPLMTISIKDPRMGRCHANIVRKSAKAFVISAAKASGKRALLSMVAGSTPPGLDAASTPPHLLLVGEVFRVGASEFRVIGYSKHKQDKNSASAYGNFTLTSGLGSGQDPSRRTSPSTSSVDRMATKVEDDYASSDEDSDLHSDSAPVNPSSPTGFGKGYDSFEALEEQAEQYMRAKIEKGGTIALVRHRPNEDEEKMFSKTISTFITEDNEEMQVSNNVDKSFGLARINEFKDVLSAFGLDKETRGITYPGLKSFLIVQGIKGPLQRRLFLINEHECTIGSSSSCSISVANDPLISPIHCRIVFNPAERHWRLVDANSRTGTFLRSTAEDQPTLIQPGQRYLLGNSQLRILGKVKEKSRASQLQRKGTGSHVGIRRQIKSVFLGKGSNGPVVLTDEQVEAMKRQNEDSPSRRSSSPAIQSPRSSRKFRPKSLKAAPVESVQQQSTKDKEVEGQSEKAHVERPGEYAMPAIANRSAPPSPVKREGGCGCTVM